MRTNGPMAIDAQKKKKKEEGTSSCSLTPALPVTSTGSTKVPPTSTIIDRVFRSPTPRRTKRPNPPVTTPPATTTKRGPTWQTGPTGCSGHRLAGGQNQRPHPPGKALKGRQRPLGTGSGGQPHAFAQLTLLNSCSLARSLFLVRLATPTLVWPPFLKPTPPQHKTKAQQQQQQQHNANKHQPNTKTTPQTHTTHTTHTPTSLSHTHAQTDERERREREEEGRDRTDRQTDKQGQVTLREGRGEKGGGIREE